LFEHLVKRPLVLHRKAPLPASITSLPGPPSRLIAVRVSSSASARPTLPASPSSDSKKRAATGPHCRLITITMTSAARRSAIRSRSRCVEGLSAMGCEVAHAQPQPSCTPKLIHLRNEGHAQTGPHPWIALGQSERYRLATRALRAQRQLKMRLAHDPRPLG